MKLASGCLRTATLNGQRTATSGQGIMRNLPCCGEILKENKGIYLGRLPCLILHKSF